MVSPTREFSTPARSPAVVIDPPRETELVRQLQDLLALPDSAIEHAMTERIRREYALDDDARHHAAAARLRAWLHLDREEARVIARAFNLACASLGTDVQVRRAQTERSVILNGMSFADFRRLVPLVDWLREEAFGSPLFDESRSEHREASQTLDPVAA